MSRLDAKPYHEFVDKGVLSDPGRYVIAIFKVTPVECFIVKDAASGIAVESSVETWTTLYLVR